MGLGSSLRRRARSARRSSSLTPPLGRFKDLRLPINNNEGPTITGIELQARREALGLSQVALAKALSVAQTTVSRWESGASRVPSGVVEELLHMEARVERLIDRMIVAAEEKFEQGEDVILFVHRDDEAFGRVHPESDGMPAVFQRVAAARARLELADDGIDATIVAADYE